jgi:hypothetical protein
MKCSKLLIGVSVCILLGLLASAVSADRVICEPLIRNGVVRGFCFTVCNTQKDPCFTDGCIWDVHLEIVRGNCTFVKALNLPKGWQGGIDPKDPQKYSAWTPDPTGLARPIRPGVCLRFCVLVNVRECLSKDPCMYVRWTTTGMVNQDPTVRQIGITKCCMPGAAGQ